MKEFPAQVLNPHQCSCQPPLQLCGMHAIQAHGCSKQCESSHGPVGWLLALTACMLSVDLHRLGCCRFPLAKLSLKNAMLWHSYRDNKYCMMQNMARIVEQTNQSREKAVEAKKEEQQQAAQRKDRLKAVFLKKQLDQLKAAKKKPA